MAKQKNRIINVKGDIQEIHNRLAVLITTVEEFKTKTRYDFSHYNAVISQQTDRIGKQNGQVDQMVRQVNAGFAEVKKDLIRAGQGLTAHERDISSLMSRVISLETAVAALSIKKGKR